MTTIHLPADVQRRTEAMAHYVIFRSKPERLGAVKLNKVMWFADLDAYRRTGKTISGQKSYERQRLGPVPNRIVIALRDLQKAGAIAQRDVPAYGLLRREHIWLTQPDLSAFSAVEVDIMNGAIDWVCDDHTAASISELSHDALWQETELGDQIAIGAASISVDEISSEDIAWAKEAMADAEQ